MALFLQKLFWGVNSRVAAFVPLIRDHPSTWRRCDSRVMTEAQPFGVPEIY
jgi:hypothetical protein